MQQVNLYTQEFRPKRVLLTLEQILLLAGLLVIVLIGVSMLMQMLVADRVAEQLEAQRKVEEMRTRVDTMQKKADALVLDQGLVQTNARLRSSLNARMELLDMLGRVVVQQGDRFSATLIALARQRMDGLWLTLIDVRASGQGLTLEGQTLRSDAVPQYLQKLRDESAFRGRTFDLFSLMRDEKATNHLAFALRAEVNDHFQPFEMATDPVDRQLVSPEAQQNLLQQMKGVKQ